MSAPVTGFEARSGASWTTLAEEAVFLSELQSLGPRLRVTAAGVNAEGHALRYIEIGYPWSDAPRDACVLLVAQQHGEEAAGREALFQLMRLWATSDDPVVIDYLSRTRVICMPTCNPDGLPIPGVQGGSYYNKAGVNINRDHLVVTQPETQLIERVITEFSPAVIVDSHENGSPSRLRCAFVGATHVAVDARWRAMGADLVLELIDRINALGYDGGHFAGSPEPSALRQVGGLRHALSVLFESDMVAGQLLARVEMQVAAFAGVIDYHRRNLDKINAIRAATRVLGTVRLAYPAVPYDFGGGSAAQSTPSGYRVTTAQRSTHDRLWGVFGLPESPAAGGVDVSIKDHYPLLPLVLDARSPDPAMSAVPLAGAASDLRLINPGTGWVPCTAHALIAGAWQAPE